MDDIRVSMATINSACGKFSENLEKHIHWTDRALKEKSDIICFPELSLTGYSSKEEFRKYSLSIDDNETKALSNYAVEKKITIMAGISEKTSEGKRYATHLIFHTDGKVSSYRKIHLAPPEINLYDLGDSLSLTAINGIKCGVQLCYDIHFPELSTAMTKNGIEILFVPHASPRGNPQSKFESWMRHLTARAFDNSIFVVACNQAGDNGMGLNFSGVSVAIDPSGDIIEKRLDSKEGIMTVNLRKEIFDHVRGHRMRYFFPNRRPEIYKL